MIERLQEIFKGLENAYGQTKITNEIRSDGKNEVKSYTIKKPITDTLWEQHVAGVEPALGIVPINEDNECKWGCIDIDTYPFDHLKLIKKIREANLPLIVFRSKSGGAHVFCFTTEFVPAILMRNKLIAMASIIGHSGVEIFPKQNTIKAERGDVGSFLNMPYHGGDRSSRYAFDDEGQPMTMHNFCQFYDEIAISKESLQRLNLNQNTKEETDFPDGPPCLQTITKQGGVSEGGRNNFLYNIGVYLKKAYPTEWESMLENYNVEKYVKPIMKATEVLLVIKSLQKKDYDYKCKDQPICDFCQDRLCFTRKFGKSGAPDVDITGIRMLDSDPPVYFVTADGETIECDPDTLHDPDRFSKLSMVTINKALLSTNKMMWKKRINKLLAEMDQPLKAPDDMRMDVILQNALVDFLSRNGKAIEDILKRRAYSENGHSWFKFKDFWRYLLGTKLWNEKNYNYQKTIRLMQNLFKAEPVTKKINKKSEKVWQIEGIKLNERIIRKNEKKKAEFEK
jgi:hypothetical protein